MRYRIVLPTMISFLLLTGACGGSGSDRGAAPATTSASTGATSGQTIPTGGNTID